MTTRPVPFCQVSAPLFGQQQAEDDLLPFYTILNAFGSDNYEPSLKNYTALMEWAQKEPNLGGRAREVLIRNSARADETKNYSMGEIAASRFAGGILT